MLQLALRMNICIFEADDCRGISCRFDHVILRPPCTEEAAADLGLIARAQIPNAEEAIFRMNDVPQFLVHGVLSEPKAGRKQNIPLSRDLMWSKAAEQGDAFCLCDIASDLGNTTSDSILPGLTHVIVEA